MHDMISEMTTNGDFFYYEAGTNRNKCCSDNMKPSQSKYLKKHKGLDTQGY